MIKVLLFAVLFAIQVRSLCQIPNMEIMLNKTDIQVTNYFDSLNHLKANPYYRVKKSVTDDGNLVLTNAFSLADESYYKCTSVITKFQRADGVEYCVQQIIIGSIEFAQSNIAYIKDHFTFVSTNRWEFNFKKEMSFKIVATFERQEGEFPSFIITYYLANK